MEGCYVAQKKWPQTGEEEKLAPYSRQGEEVQISKKNGLKQEKKKKLAPYSRQGGEVRQGFQRQGLEGLARWTQGQLLPDDCDADDFDDDNDDFDDDDNDDFGDDFDNDFDDDFDDDADDFDDDNDDDLVRRSIVVWLNLVLATLPILFSSSAS